MTCQHCGADLSGRLSKNRKWCSGKCRDDAKPRIRQRAKQAIEAAKSEKRKRYLEQCAATAWI